MLTELSLLLAMANPASVACIQAGGKLEIVRTDRGEQGLCTLPSGQRCEEWAFFRGECPSKKKTEECDEPPKAAKSAS